jgi:hypothetical protein
MSVSANFDQSYYLTNNTDVLIAISQGIFTSASSHYDLFGGKELRDPNSTFNATYYAAQNPDVLNAVAAGTFTNVFSHYQGFGETESRVPSSAFSGFDSATYLAANTDVAAAITAGSFTSALDHYLTFGQSESREGSGVATTITTGSTITLTTGVDTLTGTDANDLFAAINEASINAGDTLSTADTLNGGAGTDTLNITNTQQGALAGLVTSNIENLVIRSTNADNTVETLDLTSLVGVTKVTLDDLNDGVTVSNAVLGTDFTITDMNATAGADVTNIGYTGATGTADAATINTSNVTSASLIVDNIDTITVNNTGTKVSTLTLFDAGDAETVTWNNTTASVGSAPGLTVTNDNDNVATTYNFTGSGSTTFTSAMSTALTTISGGTSTGALDLNVSTNTNNLSLTTGSGNDRVELGALGTNFNSATNDVVSLGDGTDTISITDTSLSAGDITLIKAVTSAEVLALQTTTAESTYDLNTISVINTLRFDGAITDAVGATGGAGIAGTAADNAALILAGIESDDVITISANMTGGAGGNGGTGNTADPGTDGGNGANASAAISLAVDVDGGQNAVTLNLDGGITLTGGEGGDGGGGGNATSGNNASGAGGNAGNGASAITAGNFETITINSTGTTANTIAGGAAGALGTGGTRSGNGATGADGLAGTAAASIVINTNGVINVTGTRDINLGTVAGTNLSVDASTFTGKLTVVGEAGNNTITGGSAVDTINAAAGQDTITGGGGNDIFIFVDNQSTTAASDTITDFGLNGDKIRLAAADNVAAAGATAAAATTSVSVATGGKVTFAAADDTLAEKITVVRADITDIGTNEVVFFEHGSDSYIFNNVGGTDDLVKLTGVTGATTLTESTATAGDFTLA